MGLSSAYWFLLVVSLTVMFMQMTVAKKQLLHIVFAIFCGSIAMMAAQVLSADALGEYSVFLGLGACATCNGYWLVARALFRKQNPIGLQHILLAVLLAVLVISKKSIGIAEQLFGADLSATIATDAILGEMIGLLSSFVILMSFWEGVRGWSASSVTEQKQRLLYLIVHGGSFISTTIIATALSNASGTEIKVWFVPFAASSIIIMTQVLMVWRASLHKTQAFSPNNVNEVNTTSDKAERELRQGGDIELAEQLETLLINQQQFLQASLKVSDLARELKVSEYRISRALKNHFQADNFNRFVNQLRVEHAKQLLRDKDKAHWSVLVIGLESGFASVGPFTRAFKDLNGCTPGNFRKQVL